MASTSFGLSPEYKVGLQKQIFELVYFTKGGITWGEAYYSMPVYLRNFHYDQLVDTLKREADAIKKSSRKSTSDRGFVGPPTYVQPPSKPTYRPPGAK